MSHGRKTGDRPQAQSPARVGNSVPVVALQGVGRTFGSDPPVNAVRGVDLSVHEGEWLAISGPSGSGKSSLLNILGCLDVQTSGTYLLDGIDVAHLDDGGQHRP